MIKNVLIVGLGGVGSVYASIISKNFNVKLKILTDIERYEKYSNTPTVINNMEYSFEYILPDDNFEPDLILLTTKFNDLKVVLNNIKKFVSKDTIILSLLNGINSEEIISEFYPMSNVLKSYLICHSIIREGRNVKHDGVNTLVCESNNILKEFFEECGINYEFPNDIKSAMWQKYMLNIVANQLSAVTGMTFGEMNRLPYIRSLLKKILEEVVFIARAEGVSNPDILVENVIRIFVEDMVPYGKTSMLQDVENGRPTEVDAFAGTIITLGKKYNIPTPYNTLFRFLIEF